MSEVKLFVGNLPYDATETELVCWFSKFGRVSSVCVLGPRKSRSGNSCAFVNFELVDAAAKAIKDCDGIHPLRPCPELAPMQVRFARSQEAQEKHQSFRKRSSSDISDLSAGPPGYVKFFAGCLPPDINRFELEDIFVQNGLTLKEEEGVHIMPGKGASGQACAFIFVEESSADAVVERINGRAIIRGWTVNVRVANTQDQIKKPKFFSSPVSYQVQQQQAVNPFACTPMPPPPFNQGLGEFLFSMPKKAVYLPGYARGSSYGTVSSSSTTSSKSGYSLPNSEGGVAIDRLLSSSASFYGYKSYFSEN